MIKKIRIGSNKYNNYNEWLIIKYLKLILKILRGNKYEKIDIGSSYFSIPTNTHCL